jgi:hypothetical protein
MPGVSSIPTGWEEYSDIEEFGFKRKVTVLAGRKKKPLLPRVHCVVSAQTLDSRDPPGVGRP